MTHLAPYLRSYKLIFIFMITAELKIKKTGIEPASLFSAASSSTEALCWTISRMIGKTSGVYGGRGSAASSGWKARPWVITLTGIWKNLRPVNFLYTALVWPTDTPTDFHIESL